MSQCPSVLFHCDRAYGHEGPCQHSAVEAIATERDALKAENEWLRQVDSDRVAQVAMVRQIQAERDQARARVAELEDRVAAWELIAEREGRAAR